MQLQMVSVASVLEAMGYEMKVRYTELLCRVSLATNVCVGHCTSTWWY
jgi:hypothetical protein